ncbi:DUF3794 domain-containing protein [Desulfitobacterium metallireducens]|uniref:SipL SPOCS domain-containing protein n=1 Tax=Desulfitobacterium metallireducens DSM 15288 TaxID=871968 RepID=W0E5K5_9FIRM|nr:DUF3794 domain-containing protein [Desulfitobacterium metallireducens]AHF06145.1 hypothetical protein DESME_03085 [Desulfitobacterium metallireducens DSM 15288]
MVSTLKGLIEYEGTAQQLPKFSDPLAALKELNVEEIVDIPPTKPDIELILKVKSELVILSTKVIKTPIGKSLENQTLTGWKLIVEGELRQVVLYVADERCQSIHGAHFNVPFSTFIVLPPDFDETQCLTVEGYIEDIYAEQIGTRKIFKNITLLLVAQIS